MATEQSQFGKIELFEDFLGEEQILAADQTTGYKQAIGGFRVVGYGSEDTDAGVLLNESDPSLSGVGRVTSSATAGDVTALVTAKCFRPSLMAPMVLETRLQFPDLETKSCFIGFCDTNDNNETIPASITSTAITLTASSMVGFVHDNNATSIANWYYVFNGGTTTGDTVSANQDSSITAVAAEYDILRVEVDADGTARWFINGVLKKTLAGALSTSTFVCAFVGVESEGSAAEYMDVDYIYVSAYRDWTV